MQTTENSLSGSGVAGTIDHASNSLNKTIDKVSDAARPAVDRFAAGAHQVVDKLAGVATHAADTIGDKSGQIRDVQSRLTESCRSYMQEKPLATLGIAVATGFLLSLLLKRH